jgi:hypothetical protein
MMMVSHDDKHIHQEEVDPAFEKTSQLTLLDEYRGYTFEGNLSDFPSIEAFVQGKFTEPMQENKVVIPSDQKMSCVIVQHYRAPLCCVSSLISNCSSEAQLS